jgi:hypothetical protein
MTVEEALTKELLKNIQKYAGEFSSKRDRFSNKVV